MVDERFSAAAFAARGLDTVEARALADLLEEEVLKEMQGVVEAQFNDIIRRLNEMGHQLTPEVVDLGELLYKDDYEDEQGYHCKLLLGFDSIVTTGYAHLIKHANDFPD
ncbi:MAG: hypothetical protein ND895_19785 [Pyrinomonadaceae bacterium]|nr:hypothetical protein [Pyrinomonadaceae bacterium]